MKKKFHPGDRVRVKSIRATGTIIHSSTVISSLFLDNADMLRPKERHKLPTEHSKTEKARFVTFTDDLELIDNSKPDPDWKDIWDSNE